MQGQQQILFEEDKQERQAQKQVFRFALDDGRFGRVFVAGTSNGNRSY